jgi:hypothetical protein
MRWRSQLKPNADSYSPERTINNSRDRNVQSEIYRQENFGQSGEGGATVAVPPEGTDGSSELSEGESHCARTGQMDHQNRLKGKVTVHVPDRWIIRTV